ncbi:MAG TPA: LD-carboxypeptidase [Bacillota bacterium]|nr:LD-carboxypeptidase [Bacillota bacterium]HOL09602.1 LD-carboxypeptidase [Bacillota bacterium]HPO97238.1 LD-carboxypeptidase [Bacillota bacterium]
MKKIKPKVLTAGATIGVVAPASPLKANQNLAELLDILKRLGYQVVLGQSTQAQHCGYLAGTDTLRKTDLEQMWLDQNIDAIWCLRGGYGCLRLLADLDFSLIGRQTPKLLIGFSDITTLQLALWTKLKLVSFHGPVLTTLKSEFSRTQAIKMLSGNLTGQFEWTDPLKSHLDTVNPGTAQGTLLGGNLATLVSLIGSDYFPDLNNTVLFLEEVGESCYRVDRLLTQLLLCRQFTVPAAILIGRSVPVAGESEADLIAVFEERLSGLKIPIAYGYPIGHLGEQWTVPQGIMVEVDTVSGQVVLLETVFSS